MTAHNIAGASAREIARSIEDAAANGVLAAGAALPPIRELARTLKVSPVTVAAAYRLLRSRGLAAGHGRLGTRLQARVDAGAAMRHAPADAIDLASGNPDPALLPALGHALRALPTDRILYGGALDLRSLTTFAAGEFQADGVPATAIVVTSGALDGIERILREHLRHGDRVAIEDPGFAPLLDLLRASGYVLVPFRVDDEGPDPASFERAIRHAQAVIVTPRAQNPTGASLTAARAATLKALLRARADLLLIENDPCSAVTLGARVFLSDDPPHHWTMVRSTSKFLGPDLRLAVVAGDALTIGRVQRRQAVGPRWVSHLLQHLALSLWSDPAAGRQLARAADVYAHRRSALVAALTRHGITARGASGLNVWIPVADETTTMQGLAEHGWAVAPGGPFRVDTPPAIRVTTSALEPADAERFARDLASLGRPPAAAFA